MAASLETSAIAVAKLDPNCGHGSPWLRDHESRAWRLLAAPGAHSVSLDTEENTEVMMPEESCTLAPLSTNAITAKPPTSPRPSCRSSRGC